MGLEVKLIELRDKATFIPCIAIRLWRTRRPMPGTIRDKHLRIQDPHSHWLIGAAGYGDPLVVFGRLEGGQLTYDPFKGPQNRTWFYSHRYLQDHWDEVPDGGVVDVRVILGEATEPAESERKYYEGDL